MAALKSDFDRHRNHSLVVSTFSCSYNQFPSSALLCPSAQTHRTDSKQLEVLCEQWAVVSSKIFYHVSERRRRHFFYITGRGLEFWPTVVSPRRRDSSGDNSKHFLSGTLEDRRDKLDNWLRTLTSHVLARPRAVERTAQETAEETARPGMVGNSGTLFETCLAKGSIRGQRPWDQKER